MGISPTLYEAMKVDGANKLQELRYVTIPGMAPTLIIMVIMRIGNMLSIGYERVLLMYNSNIYVTADVLSTFEQRIGILSANYGVGASVSLFNSLIAFALVIGQTQLAGIFRIHLCGKGGKERWTFSTEAKKYLKYVRICW